MVTASGVSERVVLGRWFIANVVAFTAASGLGGGVLRAAQEPHYWVVSSMGEAVRIGMWSVGMTMAIFGAIVGAAQWWVIRKHVAAPWWLPATLVGWAAWGVGIGALSGVAGGWVNNIGPSSVPTWVYIASAVGVLVAGLLPGTPQGLILRRHIKHAHWWPVLTLVGLMAGFGIGLFVTRWVFVEIFPVYRPEADFPSGRLAIVGGPIAASVYAAVTGPALARWLGRVRPGSDAIVPAVGA